MRGKTKNPSHDSAKSAPEETPAKSPFQPPAFDIRTKEPSPSTNPADLFDTYLEHRRRTHPEETPVQRAIEPSATTPQGTEPAAHTGPTDLFDTYLEHRQRTQQAEALRADQPSSSTIRRKPKGNTLEIKQVVKLPAAGSTPSRPSASPPISRMRAAKSDELIQPSLTLGQQGDRYEQEADRVARQVVSRINAKDLAPSPPESATPETQDTVVRRAAASETPRVDTQVERGIQQARGQGQALDGSIRGPMEQAFGADFSGVRVHNNADSDQLSRKLGARAFTNGQDIHFRGGEYDVSNPSGQELLAHELTHVVQQGGDKIRRKPADTRSAAAGDPVDVHHRANASKVMSKKAGVESFAVDWDEPPRQAPTKTELYLTFSARFKDDEDHDPALAEFRQNAGSEWEITEGPGAGTKKTTPLRDDGYSRATDAEDYHDPVFTSNDFPAVGPIDRDDVIDYAFTAEQMIVDTSTGKELVKHGPHTARVTGKHPRKVHDGNAKFKA